MGATGAGGEGRGVLAEAGTGGWDKRAKHTTAVRHWQGCMRDVHIDAAASKEYTGVPMHNFFLAAASDAEMCRVHAAKHSRGRQDPARNIDVRARTRPRCAAIGCPAHAPPPME